jgi:hypothetical protein
MAGPNDPIEQKPLDPLSSSNMLRRIGRAFIPVLPRKGSSDPKKVKFQPFGEYVLAVSTDVSAYTDAERIGTTTAPEGRDTKGTLYELSGLTTQGQGERINQYIKTEMGALPPVIGAASMGVKLPRMATYAFDRTLHYPAQKLEAMYNQSNEKRVADFQKNLDPLPSAILVLPPPISETIQQEGSEAHIDKFIKNLETHHNNYGLTENKNLLALLIVDHEENARIVFMKNGKLLKQNGKIVSQEVILAADVRAEMRAFVKSDKIKTDTIEVIPKSQLKQAVVTNVNLQRKEKAVQSELAKERKADPKLRFYTGLTPAQVAQGVGWFLYSSAVFLPRLAVGLVAGGVLAATDEVLFRLPVKDTLLGIKKTAKDALKQPLETILEEDETAKQDEMADTRTDLKTTTAPKATSPVPDPFAITVSPEMEQDMTEISQTMNEHLAEINRMTSQSKEQNAQADLDITKSIHETMRAIDDLEAEVRSASKIDQNTMSRKLPTSTTAIFTKNNSASVAEKLKAGNKRKEEKLQAREKDKDTRALLDEHAKELPRSEAAELAMSTTIDPRVEMHPKVKEAAESLLQESVATRLTMQWNATRKGGADHAEEQRKDSVETPDDRHRSGKKF